MRIFAVRIRDFNKSTKFSHEMEIAFPYRTTPRISISFKSDEMFIFGDTFFFPLLGYSRLAIRLDTRRCFCWDIVCWCQVVHGNWKLINFQICGECVGRSWAVLPYFFLLVFLTIPFEAWNYLNSQGKVHTRVLSCVCSRFWDAA